MVNRRILIFAAFASYLGYGCSGAPAPELKVLVGGTMTDVLQEISADYQSRTGVRLAIVRDRAGGIMQRMRDGEDFDVVLITTEVVDTLTGEGILDSQGQVTMAQTFMSVCVRAGAAEPDISTSDSFKAAILGAKSITYTDPATRAPSAVYLQEIFDQLGISDEIASKTVFASRGAEVAQFVAEGKAEIGMTLNPELLPNEGVKVIGLIPAPLQRPAIYTAAVATRSTNKEAAHELVNELRSPAIRAAIGHVPGLEPVDN